MWTDFFLAWAIAAAILYLPGALLLRGTRVSLSISIAAAPPVAIVLYEMLCVVCAKLQIPANPLTVVLPVVLLSVGLAVGVATARRVRCKYGVGQEKYKRLPELKTLQEIVCSDGACLAAYVLLATLVAGIIFVGNLDGPASFPQDTDNSAHLGWIQSFVLSENMSTLDVSYYHDMLPGDSTLVRPEGSYYPAAWHMVCALVAQMGSLPVPLAANAVNLVFLAMVFPSAIFLFMRALFRGQWGVLYCGAAVCLAFPSFPWGLILPPAGPLYPNFASMCVLPLGLWAFAGLLHVWGRWGACARLGAYFIVSMIAVALLHPGAVFTGYVVLAPLFISFVARKIYAAKRTRSASVFSAVSFGLAAVLTLLVLAVGIWYVLYKLPALQGVINFEWPSTMSVREAVFHVAMLSFSRPNVMIVLPAIVVVGMLVTLRYREYLWLVPTFGFLAISFVVAASTDGVWDHVLTGFWYTDPVRIGANAALVGIPLAALGLYFVVRLAYRGVLSVSTQPLARWVASVFAAVLVCAFLAMNYTRHIGEIWTAFDDVETCFDLANNAERPNTFSPEEREFVEEVTELIGTEPLVLNVADDGSCFAYATDGLNLVYRRTSVSFGREGPDASYLRGHLNELATSPEVQRIIRENHIQYVLVLDEGGEPLDERCYHGFYAKDYWKGFNELTENTPGFDLVLSEGDMRLYKIEDAYRG